jgi:hypothetical protein
VDSREAAALSENPLVASVESKTVFEVRQSGTATSDAWFSLRLQSPGTTTIRVSLGDTTENLVLEAVDLPPATTSVIVESFAVLEYRAQCAWACPYLAYAPLLRLREATGNAAVEVVGLRVDVPGLTSGLCRGTIPIGPGEAQDVNRLDWYLWNNDVFFVKLDGTPIPDGPVTARAIVRSSAGEYGRIDVTGAIARGILNPALPAQIPGQYWTC